MSLRHLTVRIHSHGFMAYNLSPRGRWLCNTFSRNFVQFGVVSQRGQYQKVALKVYAAATEDRSEFRFHINTLEQFREFLKTNLIDESLAVFEYAPLPIPQSADFHMRPQWKAKPYQEPVIAYLERAEPVSKFVDLQTGRGKLQPLNSAIKIPGGWSTMGDMAVGTEVIAKDGSVTTVTAVYPQGKVDIYKMSFADGRSTECGAEHLWRVHYMNTQPHMRWRVVNTLEIMRMMTTSDPRVYVDLIDPEDCPDVELPIDPYLLGVYLGDGSSRSSTTNITTPDSFIAEEVSKVLPDNLILTKHDYLNGVDCSKYHIVRKDKTIKGNLFDAALVKLKLFNLMGYDKFIPPQYLHASKKQRLSLLQGLMDTDGSATKKELGGTPSFCSSSELLSRGVQYLIRSLGGIASIAVKSATYSSNGEKKSGRAAYFVNIRHKKPSELFRLPKKKDRTNDDKRNTETLKLRIVSIEPAGVKEAQCISIAHPDRLYVTDDFIVTHNTFCSLKAIATYGKRFAIIVKPMYIEKWCADVLKTYEIDPEEILVIKGSAQLMALLLLAREGQITEKVIIISNKTFQNWLKLYEKYGLETIDMGYTCTPQQFFEYMHIGLRLIDEAHQDFHLGYKIDLYTHVNQSISLSATLLNYDAFMEKMYEIAYPLKQRFHGLALEKYIDSFAVHYNFRDITKIKSEEFGGRGYSHNALEKSIMRHPPTLNAYFNLIEYVIDIGYLQVKRPKKKCIVFASSIQMCTYLTQHFNRRWPHLDIRRYVEDDPYENLHQADITFTTLLSAGTAHDIADLTTVILTTAVNSIQSNIQGFGRLRDLVDSPTQFYYFVCDGIDKHNEYHRSKVEMLGKRAKSFKDIFSGHSL